MADMKMYQMYYLMRKRGKRAKEIELKELTKQLMILS